MEALMGWIVTDTISGILKPVADVGKTYIEGRNRIKQAKTNAQVARWEAEASYKRMVANGDINYDIEALRQSQYSWKDEWLTLVVTAPIIGAFIPGLQGYIETGFECISEMPLWYQLSFIGLMIASFGLKSFFNKWMDSKNIFAGRKNGN